MLLVLQGAHGVPEMFFAIVCSPRLSVHVQCTKTCNPYWHPWCSLFLSDHLLLPSFASLFVWRHAITAVTLLTCMDAHQVASSSTLTFLTCSIRVVVLDQKAQEQSFASLAHCQTCRLPVGAGLRCSMLCHHCQTMGAALRRPTECQDWLGVQCSTAHHYSSLQQRIQPKTP